ncbi:MAG: hypothetical protein ACI37Z_05925 [Candidatus Gastranaerophilaceae bacterium]
MERTKFVQVSGKECEAICIAEGGARPQKEVNVENVKGSKSRFVTGAVKRAKD